MSANQVAAADRDPVVRARLDSCVFKGAVKRDDQWVAVPMCSMNYRIWSEVYDARLRDSALAQQTQPFPSKIAETDSNESSFLKQIADTI
jgi:hypothetical protein